MLLNAKYNFYDELVLASCNIPLYARRRRHSRALPHDFGQLCCYFGRWEQQGRRWTSQAVRRPRGLGVPYQLGELLALVLREHQLWLEPGGEFSAQQRETPNSVLRLMLCVEYNQ